MAIHIEQQDTAVIAEKAYQAVKQHNTEKCLTPFGRILSSEGVDQVKAW